MRNERLIEARMQRGWTQEEAAEKLEVSRVAYARWEEQGITPRQWGINKARDVFKLTPEQLGFRKYPSHTAPSGSLVQVSPGQVHIVTNVGPTVDMFSVALSALALARQIYGCTLDELLVITEQEIRRLDAMAQKQPGKNLSRRESLKFLIGLPAALLGLSAMGESIASFPAEEVLPLYVTAVPACWKLYFDGGLSEVANVLPQYISHLTTQIQQTTRYQETIASLLSQTHQLGYLLALQDQNFKTAQTHVQQAFQYAEIANDPNLRVASLIRQGNLFYTLKRPTQTVEKYEEAVQNSSIVSPLLQGQAHIGLAEAYSRFYDKSKSSSAKQAALRHQGLAREVFPANPEDDPHYAYTHFNNFTIANFEGLMHIHLEQPLQAWRVFDQVDKDIPKALVPQRVELINRQAAALFALGDLHETCEHLEQAIPSALKLGSDLRYNEACEIYQQMQERWPSEQRVKDLIDLFH